jgi:hypothetical protein
MRVAAEALDSGRCYVIDHIAMHVAGKTMRCLSTVRR